MCVCVCVCGKRVTKGWEKRRDLKEISHTNPEENSQQKLGTLHHLYKSLKRRNSKTWIQWHAAFPPEREKFSLSRPAAADPAEQRGDRASVHPQDANWLR